MSDKITIQPVEKRYRRWMEDILQHWWGSTSMVIRGMVFNVMEMPGLIAFYLSNPVGLLTYKVEGETCEIMSLNSALEGVGVGTALLNAVKDVAVERGCRRIVLITTNDNLSAIRFYQKRGYRLSALFCNAVEKSRLIKPEIPLMGNDGISIRDEIELELPLENGGV